MDKTSLSVTSHSLLDPLVRAMFIGIDSPMPKKGNHYNVSRCRDS